MNNIVSTRNKPKYEHEGYVYCFDKLVDGNTKKSWRCEIEFAKNKKCKGRIYTDAQTEEFVKVISGHGHAANAAQVEVARTITKIEENAIATQQIPSQIRTESIQNLSVAGLGCLPSQNAIRLVIQRARNRENHAPAQPANRALIEIPENYRNYVLDADHVENFLIADSGIGDEMRILVFGRSSIGNWINQVNKIYVDGTFSLAPHLFSQVFVIMAERGGFVIPILYILLPNKEETTYNRMLRMICDIWPNLNPTAISLDFELAIINSFQTVFPDANLHACLFHLVKNVKRKLAEENLLRQYNTNANFALSCPMIPALAFVPIVEMENALQVLSDELPEQLMPILDYFEDNYIGRLQRLNRRRRPLFDPNIWSCYERTINNEDRTNNFAEAAHRRMQAEFGMNHPTLWKFIDGIRSVQKSIDMIYENFVRGGQPARKRSKYIRADERILALVNDFQNREILEYLRGIANNFTMD